MTDNYDTPICTGKKSEYHGPTQMYEIETVGVDDLEQWDSYRCSTCSVEITIPNRPNDHD